MALLLSLLMTKQNIFYLLFLLKLGELLICVILVVLNVFVNRIRYYVPVYI